MVKKTKDKNRTSIPIKETKIYREIKSRNTRLLITGIIFFVVSIYFLYKHIITESDLFFLVIAIALWSITIYMIYLFYQRNRDIGRHPDVERFFQFNSPNDYLSLLEQELNDYKNLKKFGHCQVTNSFVIVKTFYRFKWFHFSEIVWAYLKQTKHSVNFIPTGTDYEIVVHLDTGGLIEIKSEKSEYENILHSLFEMAPFAIYGFDESLKSYWCKNPAEFVSQVKSRMQHFLENSEDFFKSLSEDKPIEKKEEKKNKLKKIIYYCTKCDNPVGDDDIKCPKCKSLLASDGAVKKKEIDYF